jgi:stage III sporulation protein AF
VNSVDNLAQWLRHLVTALLLAGFIEMLIPENSFKKPVKLVIGLLVLTILIQPLAGLFKVSLDPDRIRSSSRNLPDQAAQGVLKRGLEMRNRWQESFNSRQQALVKEKLESIIGLIDEVDLKEIRVLEEKSGSDRVIIKIAPAAGRGYSSMDKAKLGMKIRNSVRLVHDISTEQIEVIWDEND